MFLTYVLISYEQGIGCNSELVLFILYKEKIVAILVINEFVRQSCIGVILVFFGLD